MTTLALDSSGDLALDARKRLVVQTGADEVATRIRARLKLVRGEWFLDTSQGAPYFEAILGVKNPDMRLVRQFYTDILANTPGVKTIDELVVTLDAATRTLNVTFKVSCADGSTITATDLDAPYLVKAA